MTLRPCASCQRHIDVHAPACPFCNAKSATTGESRPLAFAVRLSRAAIFAGAAACSSGTRPDPQQPPPPPPREHEAPADAQTAELSPPVEPSPPVDAQTVAQTSQAGRATLRGVVRRAGRPIPGALVDARRFDPRKGAVHGGTVKANDKGEYVFVDLEPGEYSVVPRVSTGHRFGPPEIRQELAAGDDKRADFDIPPPPPPDRGPCCKPYGAPPARRRVV